MATAGVDGAGATVRRAGVDDAGALATLRGVMLDAMAEGRPTGSDPAWHGATARWFVAQLADRGGFAAFVADDPALGVVASACGSVAEGAPVPGALGRPTGSLFSVATDPRARRRGHARACVAAVVAWLDVRGVARTALSATPDALEIYRELGFVDRPWVQMWR